MGAALAAVDIAPTIAAATPPPSRVMQWNTTLLIIVRTLGGQRQPSYPTPSFAVMHSAIYDPVSTIDSSEKPYLVRVNASHSTSQGPAASAAHEVLVSDSKLATACRAAGDIESARAHLAAGRAIMAELVDQFPEWAQWRRDLTWFDRLLESP